MTSTVKEPASVAIVGRERELARIEAFVERAVEAPAALVLEGEPGIGKTTLWRLAVVRARERGVHVLTARAAQAERELSFAALGDLLAPAVEDIGSLPAPQRRALRVALLLQDARGTPPDERALGTALLGLLTAVAERAPLLVAVDDAQWLDDSTRKVLRFALRRAPTGVLLAQRPGDAEFTLDEADVIEVSSLGLAELDRILRAQLGAAFLRPTLVEIEQTSGGNPFFALELARALMALPRPPRPTEPLPVPANLRDLVAARLERLTQPARGGVLLAAAAARPTLTLLERAGAVALDELVAADVLVADGERIRFAHPLLAAISYARASKRDRTAAHRRLAAATSDLEERGHHLAAAVDRPDVEVAAAVDSAAAQARARGATDVAARLAARAVELTPHDDGPALHRRRLAEADAWLAAGMLDRSKAVLEAALEYSEGRSRAEVLCALAYTAANLEGAIERALELAADGLAELGSADVDLRAKFELTRSLAFLHLGQTEEAELATRAAADAAEAARDATLLARALAALFEVKFLRGRGEDMPLIRRALELSDQQAYGPSAYDKYAGRSCCPGSSRRASTATPTRKAITSVAWPRPNCTRPAGRRRRGTRRRPFS
jgi:hypothetical protein